MSWWESIAPAASAVAAAGSWLTARQARKPPEPSLGVQVIRVPSTGTVGLVIVNGGAGLARGCLFCVSGRDHYASGAIRHGFLRSGEIAQLVTDIPAPVVAGDQSVKAVVVCRDSQRIPNVWSNSEKHRTSFRRAWAAPFRRQPVYRGPEESFLRMFPEERDPRTLTAAGVTEVPELNPMQTKS